MRFSEAELSEIVQLRSSGLTYAEVSKAFNLRHPDRPKPSIVDCFRVARRLVISGSVGRRKSSGRPQSVNSEYLAAKLEALFSNDPSTSMRKAARKLGISSSSVWRIVKERGYKYHSPRPVSRSKCK